MAYWIGQTGACAPRVIRCVPGIHKTQQKDKTDDNPKPLSHTETASKGALLHTLAGIPGRILNALYAWQDAGKIPTVGTPSFRDQSPTRGDGQTDYAKPFWQR